MLLAVSFGLELCSRDYSPAEAAGRKPLECEGERVVVWQRKLSSGSVSSFNRIATTSGWIGPGSGCGRAGDGCLQEARTA